MTQPMVRRKNTLFRPAVTLSALSLSQQIAKAMVPGEWYARPDLVRVSGVRMNSLKQVVLRMLAAGLVEQGEDPDWTPHGYVKGIEMQYQAARAPRYLFRLTAEGEALRRQAMLLA